MPKITVLPHHEFCPNGAEFEVEENTNLCSALLKNHIHIEHACEMSKACTTCHVVVRKGFDELEEMDDIEADLLDRAWGLEAESRLSCQTQITNEDMVIEIPKYTLNHASENHH